MKVKDNGVGWGGWCMAQPDIIGPGMVTVINN